VRQQSAFVPTRRRLDVHCLGKSPSERWDLAVRLRRILGKDEQFEWDRAYVVRKEAQEAVGYVG